MNTASTAPERPRQPTLTTVIVAGAIVLAFRVAAWLNPSSYIEIPPAAALPIGALGVLYLACGIWAWRSRPSTLTRVFLASGIGGGVHWGGSIAGASTELEITF